MTTQPPPPAYAPPSGADTSFTIQTAFALGGVITCLSWAVTLLVTVGGHVSYSNRSDQAISAPQVAQVASEYVASVVPFLVFALFITSLTVLAGLLTLLRR